MRTLRKRASALRSVRALDERRSCASKLTGADSPPRGYSPPQAFILTANKSF